MGVWVTHQALPCCWGSGCIQPGGLQCVGSWGITGVSSCGHKKGPHTFLQRAFLSTWGGSLSPRRP